MHEYRIEQHSRLGQVLFPHRDYLLLRIQHRLHPLGHEGTSVANALLLPDVDLALGGGAHLVEGLAVYLDSGLPVYLIIFKYI